MPGKNSWDALYESTLPLWVGTMPPYEVNVEKIVFYLRWCTHPYTNLTVVSYAAYRLPTLAGDEGDAKNQKSLGLQEVPGSQ